MANVENLINKGKHLEQIPTGLSRMNAFLENGFVAGELITIAGRISSGRDLLLKQIGVNLYKLGYNVLHICQDKSMYELHNGYMASLIGTTISKVYDYDNRQQLSDALNIDKYPQRGDIYFHQFKHNDDLQKIYDKASEKMGEVDIVLIEGVDSFGFIEPHIIRDFNNRNNVTTVVTTQASKWTEIHGFDISHLYCRELALKSHVVLGVEMDKCYEITLHMLKSVRHNSDYESINLRFDVNTYSIYDD